MLQNIGKVAANWTGLQPFKPTGIVNQVRLARGSAVIDLLISDEKNVVLV